MVLGILWFCVQEKRVYRPIAKRGDAETDAIRVTFCFHTTMDISRISRGLRPPRSSLLLPPLQRS